MSDDREFSRKIGNWPTGSKERVFGSTPLAEVLEKAKVNRLPDLTAPQSPHEDQSKAMYEAMSQAIRAIEVVYPLDPQFTPQQLDYKKHLDCMNLKTVSDITRWRDGWLLLIKKV